MVRRAASVPLKGNAPAAEAHPHFGFRLIFRFKSDNLLIFSPGAFLGLFGLLQAIAGNV